MHGPNPARPHRTISQFVSALAAVGIELKRHGEQYEGCCLFCGGSKRFRLLELGGNVVAKCRECDFSWPDLLKRLWPNEAAPTEPGPRLYLGDDNKTWICIDPETGATAQHTRRPYVQDGKVGKDFTWPKGTKTKRLIYRARLTGAGPLVVTEGEKCSDAVAALGIDSIGIVTGAPTVPLESALVDCRGRDVLLWPDGDDAGRKLMHAVAALRLEAASVRSIDPARLGGVHDAADWPPPVDVDALAAIEGAALAPEDPELMPAGALDGPPLSTDAAHAAETEEHAEFRTLRDCPDVAAPIDWLWQHRIPRGRLTLISGAPDAGKSMLAVAIAAAVSRGLALPADEPRPAGSVAWIGAEDEDGVPMAVARLRAAGADPDRVILLQEAPGDYEIGIGGATKAAREYEPDVVIVDSHMSWFTESNDGQKVRQELRYAFRRIMAGGAAVLLICHWRKAVVEDGPGHFRAAGSSGGLVGAARSQLDIEKLDGPARIMRCIKHSGAPESDDVRFDIVAAGLVGRVEWAAVTPRQTAEDIGEDARRLIEYMAAAGAGMEMTISHIRGALGAKSEAQRDRLGAAIGRLVTTGQIKMILRKVRGVDRRTYELSEGAKKKQLSAIVGNCLQLSTGAPKAFVGSEFPPGGGNTQTIALDLPVGSGPAAADPLTIDPAGPQPAAAAPSEPAPDAPATATAGAAGAAPWWSQYAATWTTCTICSARAACVPDDSGERYACRQCADRMQRAGAAQRRAGRGVSIVNVTVAA